MYSCMNLGLGSVGGFLPTIIKNLGYSNAGSSFAESYPNNRSDTSLRRRRTALYGTPIRGHGPGRPSYHLHPLLTYYNIYFYASSSEGGLHVNYYDPVRSFQNARVRTGSLLIFYDGLMMLCHVDPSRQASTSSAWWAGAYFTVSTLSRAISTCATLHASASSWQAMLVYL